MDLFLQYGHGMKAHSEELIKSWDGGSVIFSPKNMSLEQMISSSEKIKKTNGHVYLDPQFYIPRSDNGNLNEHSFWPQSYSTNSFFNGTGINDMMNTLVDDYLLPIQASTFILPSFYLEKIDDDWNRLTDSFIEGSIKSLSR